MEEALKQIDARFLVREQDLQRKNLAFITVNQNVAVEAIAHLRDFHGYRHLVIISAVDFIEDNVFQLTYLLHNYKTHTDIGVRVDLPRDTAVMDSIHHLWPAAQVYQQELKEMFGIGFPGSPRLDEPMILEGWDDMPPMRKEFDTKKYSDETYFPREGRYTLDPKEEMEKKLYSIEAEVKYEIRDVVRRNRADKDA